MNPIIRGMLDKWHGLNRTDKTPQPKEARTANAALPDNAELKKEKMSSTILLRYVYSLRLQELVYLLFGIKTLMAHQFFSVRVFKYLCRD